MCSVSWLKGLGACALGVALVGCGATKRNGGAPASEPMGQGGIGGAEQGSAGDASVNIADPGFLPVHRLTREEYDNTTTDLLGTSARYGSNFPPDGNSGLPSDATQQSQISPLLAAMYMQASEELVREVFETAELKQRVLTCQGASAGDEECARLIITRFGRRAWRRPLEPEEVDQLLAHYQDALGALEKDHEGAVAHVMRIMLTSMKFVYLIEIDPDLQVAATQGRDLNGYELASRLSYALWGAPPDEQLVELAASDELLEGEMLLSEANRLLGDARSGYFTRAFLAQLLRVRTLSHHHFDPMFSQRRNEELALAMTADSDAFMTTFALGGRPWSELLTAELPAAPGLDDIYAGDPPGIRRGLLTLPAILASISLPDDGHSRAVRRGTFVMKRLFCEEMSLSPGVSVIHEPNLPPSTNPREALEQYSSSAACAACHDWIDPIGFALDNFDAIGRYRTTWDSGDLIDTSGTWVAGGENIDEPAPRYSFSTLNELLPVLATDARLPRCASRKLLSYLVRRMPREQDEVFADALGDEWASGDLRVLLGRLLESDVFRRRKLPEDAL